METYILECLHIVTSIQKRHFFKGLKLGPAIFISIEMAKVMLLIQRSLPCQTLVPALKAQEY